MEPELSPSEESLSRFENLHKVTPLSKYLAMTLFVLLPFVGGWVGYMYALEKVEVIEKIVEVEKIVDIKSPAFTSARTSRIVLAQDIRLDPGHRLILEHAEVPKYVVDMTQLTAFTSVHSDLSTSHLHQFIKLNDEYVIVRIMTNPSGIFTDYLVNELTSEVVREITNYPQLFVRGVWSSQGTHYFVSENQVIAHNYIENTTDILYQEVDPSLSIIEDDGLGAAWGILALGSSDDYLLVARYKVDTAATNNKDRFFDVKLIPLTDSN